MTIDLTIKELSFIRRATGTSDKKSVQDYAVAGAILAKIAETVRVAIRETAA